MCTPGGISGPATAGGLGGGSGVLVGHGRQPTDAVATIRGGARQVRLARMHTYVLPVYSALALFLKFQTPSKSDGGQAVIALCKHYATGHGMLALAGTHGMLFGHSCFDRIFAILHRAPVQSIKACGAA